MTYIYTRLYQHTGKSYSYTPKDFANAPKGESSTVIRKRVVATRTIQTKRFKDVKGVYCNARMPSHQMEEYTQLDVNVSEIIGKGMKTLKLYTRPYERIRKVVIP